MNTFSYFKTFQVYSSCKFIYCQVVLVYYISKLFKFTVHIDWASKKMRVPLFQNFSSLQFIAVNAGITESKDEFQNFSSLQFIKYRWLKPKFTTISKLFKFTVHMFFLILLKYAPRFQNFSSLQFIEKILMIRQTTINFKTFQVYSSWQNAEHLMRQVVQFQNFSSLQFILPVEKDIEQIKQFQNFSSLQFIRNWYKCFK